MGLFDGPAATAFRKDSTGQPVYAPFGSLGGVFRVNPPQADRIKRELKATYAIMLVSICVVQLIAGWRYALFLTVPVWLAGYLLLCAIQSRRLERLPVSVKELPRVSAGERLTNQSRAIGSRTLAFFTVTSALFTAGGIWMLTLGGDNEGWLVAGFFGMCTVSTFVQWCRARDR